MESTKTTSRFLRFLIAVLVLAVVAMVIGRNHFVLGTGLIIGRWVWVFFAGLFWFLSKRRVAPNWVKMALPVALGLLLLEFGWTQASKASLDAPQSDTEVSIMTYNVFFKNKRPEQSLAVIKAANPDILVLQEVSKQWAVNLDKSLKLSYPYQHVLALNGTHGTAIYSKFPLSNTSIINNTSNRPIAQMAEVDIHGNRIQLVNVHLASPGVAVENPDRFFALAMANYYQRERQLDKLQQLLDAAQTTAPTQVYIGDFNTTEFEPLYRQLRSHWVDLQAEVGTGWGFNFPHTSKMNPLIRLDYILIRGNIAPVSIEVQSGGSSDHLAVMGKVTL